MTNTQNSMPPNLSSKEFEFIKTLKSELKNLTVDQRDEITPANPDNFMDSFGLYIQDMLVNISDQEIIEPSSTREEYLSKVDIYCTTNSSELLNLEFVVLDSPFYIELTELLKSTYQNSDPYFTIEQLKFIESSLVNSDLLEDIAKTQLLMICAGLKYSKSTIFEFGVRVGEYEVNASMLELGWFDCFETTLDSSVQLNMQGLIDTSNPFTMAGNWIGLPKFLAATVAEGIYDGISNC